MIAVYFKLSQLPEHVRVLNKIRSKSRLDCVSYLDMLPDGYKGLMNFINAKGQLFYYKTPCREFVVTETKRLAEWSLTGGSLNFSSIYVDDTDYPEFGYGYPNANRLLSNNSSNPLFVFRNDGYLFIANRDYTEIEVLVIQDGRNLINSYYQKLIDGGFDEQLGQMRKQARAFHIYDGL